MTKILNEIITKKNQQNFKKKGNKIKLYKYFFNQNLMDFLIR